MPVAYSSEALAAFSKAGKKKIALSGSTGLVGKAFSEFARLAGHEVIPLVRHTGQHGSIYWDPLGDQIEAHKLEGLDAVVHLAGENIASGLWTSKKKALIRDSRIRGTTLLASTLARCQQPPAVFISASAIGYYGDRGSDLVEESSARGAGFLADTSQGWEDATKVCAQNGIRTVIPRIGVVFSERGGALARMLTPFRLGLGGRLGSGNQYMSWISLTDLVRMLAFCVTTPRVSGPINAVAPQPVTNAELTRLLSKALHRPAILHVPAPLLRFLLGDFAKEVLLSSARVSSKKIESFGFTFEHPTLESMRPAILS
ncbi:MAG: TIGR01777 family oxidoreductase [Oligoflexia bacterium]|nr:TIGR01777 family oxidoreductase [Oligoflexia bacterium]